MSQSVLSTNKWEADVLRKLSLLMDGAAANYEAGKIHHSHPGSVAPPNQVSLYQYHEARLARLLHAGPHLRRRAIAEAECDWASAKWRKPAYNSPDSDENKAERDKQIVGWLEEGRDMIWICVFAGLHHQRDHGKRYVERVRERWLKLKDEPVAAKM